MNHCPNNDVAKMGERSMIQIRPTRRAARVPHRHMLAALALDVVPDHARAQEAAAGAAAGSRGLIGWVVEHVRTTVGCSARAAVWRMMLSSLATLDRLALQHVGGVTSRECVGHLHQDLAFAMWAEALLAGVLIFNFEDMSVGTFDLNSHGRPASPTAEDLE